MISRPACLGRVVTRRGTYHTASSKTVNVGMNAGDSESSSSSSSYSYGGGRLGHSDGSNTGRSNTWGENRARGSSRNESRGYSESMELAMEGGDFGRELLAFGFED